MEAALGIKHGEKVAEGGKKTDNMVGKKMPL